MIAGEDIDGVIPAGGAGDIIGVAALAGFRGSYFSGDHDAVCRAARYWNIGSATNSRAASRAQ